MENEEIDNDDEVTHEVFFGENLKRVYKQLFTMTENSVTLTCWDEPKKEKIECQAKHKIN